MSDGAFLTVEEAFGDANDEDAFRSLAARGPGWDTVAFAGRLGKRRLLDMLPGGPGGGDRSGEKEDAAATVRRLYIGSLPWLSEEQPGRGSRGGRRGRDCASAEGDEGSSGGRQGRGSCRGWRGRGIARWPTGTGSPGGRRGMGSPGSRLGPGSRAASSRR